jgi:DNA-binding XRE family transcriptional regulator
MSARKSRSQAQPERGRRIAEARKRAGLSQPQLAEKVGVGRATIARIEAGTVPSLAVAFSIARELNEPVETLFWGGA